MRFCAVTGCPIRVGKTNEPYTCQTGIFGGVMPPENARPYYTGPKFTGAGKRMAIQYSGPCLVGGRWGERESKGDS